MILRERQHIQGQQGHDGQYANVQDARGKGIGTILKTVWLLLLALFILVSPICLAASPVESSSKTWSAPVTISSLSPATYTPASLLSWICSLLFSIASKSLMSSLYSCEMRHLPFRKDLLILKPHDMSSLQSSRTKVTHIEALAKLHYIWFTQIEEDNLSEE